MERYFMFKKFHKGNLKGIVVLGFMNFVSEKRAEQWLEGIKKNYKKLDYEITYFAKDEMEN